MIATIVNAVLVIIGSILGLLLKNRMSERISNAIFSGLGLCVAVIGISGAIGTEDMLCVIICMVVGIVIGFLIGVLAKIPIVGILVGMIIIFA